MRLAWDDIQDHTNQDNPEGSCSSDESEEEEKKPRSKRTFSGKDNVVADEVNTNSSGPVTTTISFPSLGCHGVVRKHGRI